MLTVERPQPMMTPKTAQIIKRFNDANDEFDAKVEFFDKFTPNSGGQETFTNLLGFPSLQNIPPKFVFLKGGIGAGKTFLGAFFACSRALLEPEARGLISANEYGQLETSTLVGLAEFCKTFNIPLEPSGADRSDPGWADETAKAIAARRQCTIGKASVLVLSANKFSGVSEKSKEGGRGLQIRWFWGDEWCYAPESAFITVNGRIGRGPGKMKGLGVITSTINRNNPFNWVYDNFDGPDRTEDQIRLFRSIVLPSRENIKHLGEDYVSSLESSYTDELRKIELEGIYAATMEGRVYRYFSRSLHVLSGDNAFLCDYKEGHPIHVSIDFNHSPACAIAAQIIGDDIHIIREWYIKASDTFELAQTITEWISGLGYEGIVDVHGDASGNQRTANSRVTNWQIVWNAFNVAGIKGLGRYAKANPSIADSVNSVNLALKNDRLFFNGSCKELIKDMESMAWDGNKLDKSDIARSHLQDCLRYLIWDVAPFSSGQQWSISNASYSH